MATFFHSYQLLPDAPFHRYRLEQLALSALLLRKWKSPDDEIVLVTDFPTRTFLDDLGALKLYDDVVIPYVIGNVDPQYFFALIKLRGLTTLCAPVYSLDWDVAVLTQELFDRIKSSRACGLHYECSCGNAYNNPSQYYRYLPSNAPGWKWSPINAGIVGFVSEADKWHYLDIVIDFMREYSAHPIPDNPAVFAMMFAEQQILGWMSPRLGLTPLFNQGSNGLFQDGTCFHLWGNKFSLDENIDERNRHRKWCRDTMNQHGIDIPKFLDSPCAEALP